MCECCNTVAVYLGLASKQLVHICFFIYCCGLWLKERGELACGVCVCTVNGEVGCLNAVYGERLLLWVNCVTGLHWSCIYEHMAKWLCMTVCILIMLHTCVSVGCWFVIIKLRLLKIVKKPSVTAHITGVALALTAKIIHCSRFQKWLIAVCSGFPFIICIISAIAISGPRRPLSCMFWMFSLFQHNLYKWSAHEQGLKKRDNDPDHLEEWDN